MSQMGVLNKLIEQGWISLRQLGVLLDLPDRSIYSHQRSKNPVPTIRIGGIERVYTDSVKEILERDNRAVLLSVLETGLKKKDREEKQNA